ncbi:MAG: stage III sporulation protein AE [Eubacterium sp.]|nr:stage III sporulation protein AE [Eubacterium sp.]
MDLSVVWQDYGLDRLQEGMSTLFPQKSLSLEQLLGKVISGDILGALAELFTGSIAGIQAQFSGMKNILVWLLILGIVSSLMNHFVEIFDRHQVADISFYFMYLLFSAVLLGSFSQAAQVAEETMENVILFVKLLVPAYLISVGVAAGAVTAGASYQMMLLVIYGVECILMSAILPLIYSYVMLSMINGIWAEEKLTLLIELLGKVVGWILKAAIGVVTGISLFQALITPLVDSAQSSALQKLLSSLPGVGNLADGAVELVLGSAMILKNSIGVVLLLLLVVLCAAPLCKIALIAFILKCAAAFMEIVSDKRITACADRTGNGSLLLLRTAGTAMFLFLIAIAACTASLRRF